MAHAIGSLAGRYSKLVTERSAFMDEAYNSALLTLPSVFPDNTDARDAYRNTAVVLTKPYQSLGARGVNNLSSKLLLTLFPPSSSFFRYEIDPKLLNTLSPEDKEGVVTDLQQGLSERERRIMVEIDSQALRTKLHFALKSLIVTGNVLVYQPPSGGMRVFPLNHYVVRRDGMGNLLEVIVVEILDYQSLDETQKAIVDAKREDQGDENRDRQVNLYTGICRDGNVFRVHQELEDTLVPGTEGSYQLDKTPWLALRFIVIDGEDYGRGYVEEYRGDLIAYEKLREALVIASLNAAKLVPIVKPNSLIKPKRLMELRNGEAVSGNPDDVTFLQQLKHADMQQARAEMESIRMEIAADFLMNSSFQRQGERVTAEEIRRMAEELEDTLGGVYSVLSVDLQLPVPMRIEQQLIASGALDPLPPGTVRPAVVTGLAAIGRGHDLQRLREGLSMVAELAPVFPEAVQYIKGSDIVKRIFIGVGVDTSGLLKTSEQVAQENQARSQQQAMQTLGEKGTAPVAKVAAEELLPRMFNGGAPAPQQ